MHYTIELNSVQRDALCAALSACIAQAPQLEQARAALRMYSDNAADTSTPVLVRQHELLDMLRTLSTDEVNSLCS